MGLPFLFLDLRALRWVSVREWLQHELAWSSGGIGGGRYVVWKKWSGSVERDMLGVWMFGDRWVCRKYDGV